MNINQLFADEDAVSPVIGVILMVAITVILAAVIGTFVLGLGENVQDSSPQANFQFEYTDSGDGFEADDNSGDTADTITITHTGGEDVSRSELSIQISSITLDSIDGSTAYVADGWESTVSTGDSLEFNDNADVDADVGDSTDEFVAGDTVRVVWTSPSGGTSNTIGQSTVPS